MRIIFAGTPAFAVPCLAELLKQPNHEVVAIYTQPDRPAGRGRKLCAPPVKMFANTYAPTIPILQPETLRDITIQQTLIAFEADIMVVVAYGLLLPKIILQAPKLGCINVHASLLPRWRGAAPIQQAILSGDPRTGVTIMQMVKKLDAGAMLTKASIPIETHDTSDTLHQKLAALGANLLIETLAQLPTLTPTLQHDDEVTYAAKIEKQDALINWQEPAMVIERKIRAYQPWPIAFTHCENTLLRIWEAHVLDETTNAVPGSVIRSDRKGIDVATFNNILRIARLQIPGGKILATHEFLQGKNTWLTPGVILH